MSQPPTRYASVLDGLARRAIGWTESGRLPDRLVRVGMDRVVASRLRRERRKTPKERARFVEDAWAGPLVEHAGTANEQHYEVPAAFFELVLGPRLKYSSAYWPELVGDLAEAEEAMLELTALRAGVADGQAVLDLGCGWGSFALWAAVRYPGSQITAVSNSGSQRRYIERVMKAREIGNLDVVTADVAAFDPGRRFDRIVSVEMLEHVRNHRALFGRMAGWLEEDGAAFVHVFAHKDHAYPFETGGSGAWMARTFFTGGVMPSRRLLTRAAEPFLELAGDWWLDGTHYARTLEAWLSRFDGRADEVRAVLEPVYGDDTDLWMQRWRMFFMACAQMFGHRSGSEWGVAHHLFVPRR